MPATLSKQAEAFMSRNGRQKNTPLQPGRSEVVSLLLTSCNADRWCGVVFQLGVAELGEIVGVDRPLPAKTGRWEKLDFSR